MYSKIISSELNIPLNQVTNTISLLDEGSTIPFISRYRKEMTGALDEIKISDIKDRYQQLQEINSRRETILNTIEKLGQLTDELAEKIKNSWDANELEDLYLPYKPKRKTRAVMAREKGLEPLAEIIFKQDDKQLEDIVSPYLNDEVADIDTALQGARDIIAEWISEDLKARHIIRQLFEDDAVISSRVVKNKEAEAIKYLDYFEYNEPLRKCRSHRLLAIRRGEKEGFLKVSITPDNEIALERLMPLFVKGRNSLSDEVKYALEDSYKRLLAPSIENEVAAASRTIAEMEAIKVFATNLRQLLLAPPLGQKRVMAIDPGFRTGCKVVCLDAQGQLLHNETIYPHPPQKELKQAARKIETLVEAYKTEVIAIGNGTASRETEAFIRKIHFKQNIRVFVVSEDGASVYSASKTARDEFPDFDVTVRGAVSIGRRLMDPLAELVKIDPKSIGVGQYQHDVNQNQLKSSLGQVVESCVNQVGVELNTASYHLLSYISGLSPVLAKNIVDYRNENGAFSSRSDLKKVARLGPVTFEQCAGFLRIEGGINPLDNSAVHPESYSIVEKMASDLNCSVNDLLHDSTLRNKINLENYVTEKTGMPTLLDIIEELEKPGRDPRQIIKVFEFSPDVYTIEDLKAGMLLPGIVSNITNFGAFVDVGVGQDGLVHISQLADKFVSDPNDIVSLNQHVEVKVLEVDVQRKRIQLTMRI